MWDEPEDVAGVWPGCAEGGKHLTSAPAPGIDESCQALNFRCDPFIPVNIERMRAVVLCLAPEAEKFL